jgi:cytochrome c oxidase assembly factor CtaG
MSMDRKFRIVAAVLGALAGILQLYNVIAERPTGTPWPLGGLAMGLFWLALSVWVYSGSSSKAS